MTQVLELPPLTSRTGLTRDDSSTFEPFSASIIFTPTSWSRSQQSSSTSHSYPRSCMPVETNASAMDWISCCVHLSIRPHRSSVHLCEGTASGSARWSSEVSAKIARRCSTYHVDQPSGGKAPRPLSYASTRGEAHATTKSPIAAARITEQRMVTAGEYGRFAHGCV